MRISPAGERDTVKRVAHRLPCTIHMDGEAPTARAYCPFPEPMPSFRGRHLRHGTFDIPEDSNIVFVESAQSDMGDSQPSFEIKYQMESKGFFYQHDDYPTSQSAFPSALAWLSISKALHEPISTKISSEPPKTAEN